MSQIYLLHELQNLDTQSDENAAARAKLQNALADSVALQTTRANTDQSAEHNASLQSKLRALELETGTLSDKLKQVNERLYSGRITNAKELSGLNDDEKMLAKRKRELEEQAYTLMEQIETSDKLLAEKRAALEKISNDTEKQHTQERAALLQLDASDADLAQKRAQLRAQLDTPTLRTYDHLRATKKGRALAPVKHSACGMCGYAIPGGLISRIKIDSDLVYCTNCERILIP